jgi:positive regulator of sigma E activity
MDGVLATDFEAVSRHGRRISTGEKAIVEKAPSPTCSSCNTQAGKGVELGLAITPGLKKIVKLTGLATGIGSDTAFGV